tara:strand:- start:111 stop:509 length:399 start_codon:yes stop_codon:yes gene_type:complete
MSRPRFTEVSEEVANMFLKATNLADRLDELEKGKKCPSCGEMNCMAKAGGCGTMAKAQPEYSESYNTKPQDVTFVAESGGQTRNAYYTTNNYTLDSDDVANKGATSTNVNLDVLRSMMNPHENPAAGHLTEG